MVIVFVIGGDALDDLHRLIDGGLLHHDGLEAALQGGVLFNILAVLGQGGGADDLDLPAGQGGLEDVGGVHAALGVACAHDVVDLVNDQDDVAQLFDLVDQALHAGLELAAELGARHQGGQVQQIDLLVLKLIGNVAQKDLLGQALGDGSLAHAGLADETGVVLLTAVEDLDGAGDLRLAAHDPVQLALGGFLGQRDAVVFQKLALGRAGAVSLAGLFLLFGARIVRGGGAGAGTAEELVQKGKGGGAPLVVLVPVLVGAFHQPVQTLRAFESGHHLVGQALQILVGETHLLDHILHGLETHFLGALQAKPLVVGLAVFNFCDKYHSHIFVAAGT